MSNALVRPPAGRPSPFRVVHLNGNEWGITSPYYSKLVHTTLKAVPGLIWNQAARAWTGYIDAVDAGAKRLVAAGVKVDASLTPDPGDQSPPITVMPVALADLREYQRTGVLFMVAHAKEGAFLADDLGLGKTLQIIRAARALRGRTVFIMPKFLREVWATGIRGDKTLTPPTPVGWPHLNYRVLEGTQPFKGKPHKDPSRLRGVQPIPEDVHAVLVNFDIVHAWLDALLAWKPETLAIDEAHMLMGDRSRRTRTIGKLARACAYRMMGSGTPMQVRPRDLWAPFNLLSEGRFGANPFTYFLAYCGAFQKRISAEKVVWDFKGASNEKELHRRLQFFMLRRTKKDVALELPKHQRQIIEVDIDKRFVMSVSAALQNEASLHRALSMAADGKLGDAASLVLGHVRAGHKVIVGCWRRVIGEAIANALQGEGVNARCIHGQVPVKKRVEIVAEKPDVVCLSLDMAVGLDLTFADVGVIAELHPVPSKLVQFEGRYYRFRQNKAVLSQYVVARGTVDEILRDGLLAKMRVSDDVVGKRDDKLREDLEALEKDPVTQLKSLYDRMKARQAAQPDAEIEDE